MRGVIAAGLLVGCYSPKPNAGAPCPDGVCPSGLVCSPATQTCELTAADAAIAVTPDAFIPPIDSAMPSSFLYRRRITIKNNAALTMPAGFTVKVPLATLASLVTAGKVKADFSDLRVIGDVASERDRVVDPPTGVAPPAVWFSLATSLAPGQTTTDFALYYGFPTSGAAPANGSAVFQIYDDFTTGISNQWLKNDAPTTTAGKLILRANRTDALTTNAATDGIGIVSAIELSVAVTNPDSNPTVQTNGTFYYWFGYQHTGDFVESDPWIVWIARGKGQLHGEQKSPVGCEAGCDGPYLNQDTAQHYYAIERDPAASRFYRDGTLTFTSTVGNSTDYSPMLRNFAESSDMHIDWVRVRARVPAEPSVTVGNEEAL